jgi:phage tail-like protein
MADGTSGNTQRFDPQLAFCFKVSIQAPGLENGDAYFKSVGGLKYESEVVDYKEGGFNIGTRRLVGGAKWGNLVLKRGFIGPASSAGANALLEWRRAWLAVEKFETEPLKRANGIIQQLDSSLQRVVCGWKFHNGWPAKWEVSELDASKSEIVIETLEIAHEGLEFLPTGTEK